MSGIEKGFLFGILTKVLRGLNAKLSVFMLKGNEDEDK